MHEAGRCKDEEPAGTRSGVGARFGALLGSPVVLASSIVCLVAVVGLVSTFSTYRALRESGERHEHAAIDDRTRGLRSSLLEALSVADVVLSRIEPGARENLEPTALVRFLSNVAFAPRGLTWASVSFPDGSFVGVHRVRGELIGVASSVDTRTEIRYRITEDAVRPIETLETSYDPREREFYRLALDSNVGVWTEPYPFLPDHHIGVTRAIAMRDGSEVRAVITADFDASELSKLFGSPITRGERALVMVGDTVLAMRGVVARPLAVQEDPKAQRIHDLEDEVVVAANRNEESGDLVVVGGARYRVSRQAVGAIGERVIELMIIVPEAELYERATKEARAGMITTAVVALFGLFLATLLSANVASLRRRREEAESAAARLREEILSLGSYELGERVGAGGMGEVYRATHRLLAREAAVKLIRVSEGGDVSSEMERFFVEARTLASLTSLHTVEVYDFGVTADDRYFLAMELLRGLDLDALVRVYGPQRPARVAAILAQVCDSLAEVHDAGLVHQDIKPANIFLCHIAEALDFVKVLDFGLSRAVGVRLREDENVEGTPAYMAPEQARAETLTSATDLYALGGVGYFLLTGTHPYAGRAPSDYMRAHVEDPIPELVEPYRSSTPDELQVVIKRCLAKDPTFRPSSARALGAVFRRIASEHRVTFSEDEVREFWSMREAVENLAARHRATDRKEERRLLRTTINADLGI